MNFRDLSLWHPQKKNFQLRHCNADTAIDMRRQLTLLVREVDIYVLPEKVKDAFVVVRQHDTWRVRNQHGRRQTRQSGSRAKL